MKQVKVTNMGPPIQIVLSCIAHSIADEALSQLISTYNLVNLLAMEMLPTSCSYEIYETYARKFI